MVGKGYVYKELELDQYRFKPYNGYYCSPPASRSNSHSLICAELRFVPNAGVC